MNRLIYAIGAAAFLTSPAVFAVTAPYAENFDSYPTGSMPGEFELETTGSGVFFTSTWDVENPSGSAGVYRNSAAGDSVSTTAALQVTNLAQRDFVLSTTFVVNTYGSFTQMYTDINGGLSALASNYDLLSSGYHLSYELVQYGYGFPATGALELSAAHRFYAVSPTTLPVAVGQTYTMTLTGTYSPSGLLLTGTLSDGSNIISVTYNDTAPALGSYFGYYDFASGLYNHGAYVTIDYDNLSLTGGSGASLVSAASVLAHGDAGSFAVEMPLTGPTGVEDRSATTYNAAFTFDRLVTSGQVSVLNGTATVGEVTFSGSTMTAQLTDVTPAEVVTLHIENINGDGKADGDIPFGFLVGDADANRVVDKADEKVVVGQRKQPVMSANFREDINADGRIKRPDVVVLRNNRGHTIP